MNRAVDYEIFVFGYVGDGEDEAFGVAGCEGHSDLVCMKFVGWES